MTMGSAITAVRTHARNERFKKNVESVINKLSLSPNQPVRVSTRLAKWILIDYPTLICSGKLYSTRVRSLGAGVQELYLEEKE